MTNDTQINLASRRIANRRARDPYFDALCDTYADLEQQVAGSKMTELERARLKRQEASLIDTILFMLEDTTTHKHAA